MNLNKNISIWRGDSTPPTNYHFWIKSNGLLFTFNGEKWVNFVEDIPTASLESKGLMSSLDKVNLEECVLHLEDTSNPHSVTKAQVGLSNVTNDAQVKRSEMGVANGVATLDADGKVPTSQLPSYVDDIIDVYATYSKSDIGVLSNVTLYLDAAHTQLITGEAGKIYQNIADGEPPYLFRWTGTIFSLTGASSLILGEVTGTAYDGAKGKANADNIAKIKRTLLSHIKDAPITTAADKVSLNYECFTGNQYGYTTGTAHTADIPAATIAKAGVMSAADKTKLDSLAAADEEDITVVDGKIKLKDRDTTNGMGYKILRLPENGILTQDMINQANTIYEIRYNFDLNGATITIPLNCTLKFEGGKLSNGIVSGNSTDIVGKPFFESTILVNGTWACLKASDLWFSEDMDFHTIMKNLLILSPGNIQILRSYEVTNSNNIIIPAVDVFIDFNGNKVILTPRTISSYLDHSYLFYKRDSENLSNITIKNVKVISTPNNLIIGNFGGTYSGRDLIIAVDINTIKLDGVLTDGLDYIVSVEKCKNLNILECTFNKSIMGVIASRIDKININSSNIDNSLSTSSHNHCIYLSHSIDLFEANQCIFTNSVRPINIGYGSTITEEIKDIVLSTFNQCLILNSTSPTSINPSNVGRIIFNDCKIIDFTNSIIGQKVLWNNCLFSSSNFSGNSLLANVGTVNRCVFNIETVLESNFNIVTRIDDMHVENSSFLITHKNSSGKTLRISDFGENYHLGKTYLANNSFNILGYSTVILFNLDGNFVQSINTKVSTGTIPTLLTNLSVTGTVWVDGLEVTSANFNLNLYGKYEESNLYDLNVNRFYLNGIAQDTYINKRKVIPMNLWKIIR